MNPFSRDHQSHTREPAATQASSTLNPSGKAPQDSHTGGKSTGGKVGTVPTAANTGLGIEKPKAFDAQGAIGKQFTEQGAIGSVGEAVGGPLSSDGMIGKQFTTEGTIGGAIQNAMGGTKKTSG
ncbi:hypothetical protein QBC42DRAFT_234810 [Cladorrhinum samala]|uniref:Uncharacterized protein n=1 Tax=Cladorrhinum samala TaxID=585594 RepID=A0AAV9HBS4_9PEZI|nr:hypothetical protein QBC42DRAFT_234810 [Cladorrhinum samala]